MSAGWSILVLGVERFGVVVSKFGRHVELAGFEIVAHVPAARKELVIDRPPVSGADHFDFPSNDIREFKALWPKRATIWRELLRQSPRQFSSPGPIQRSARDGNTREKCLGTVLPATRQPLSLSQLSLRYRYKAEELRPGH